MKDMLEITSQKQFNALLNDNEHVNDNGVRLFIGLSSDLDLAISNYKENTQLSFKNCTFNGLSIDNSHFIKHFYIIQSKIVNISIDNSTFEEACTVNNTIVSGNFHARKNEFKNRLRVCGGKKIFIQDIVGDISIKPNPTAIIDDLYIQGFIQGDINIVNDTFNSSTSKPNWTEIKNFVLRPDLKGEFFLQRAIVDSLELRGNNISGRMRMDLVKVNQLKLVDFNNWVDGGLVFSRILPTGDSSQIEFISSNLGRTYFKNTELNDFNNFIFFDSEFSDSISHNCSWHEKIQIEEINLNPHKPDFSEYSNKNAGQETYYRSVRKILLKAGDIFGHLQFRKHELNQRLKRLEWKNDFLSKISLIFSKYSSSHGTNWLQSLVSLFIMLLLFWITMNILYPEKLLLSDLFMLMNPAHDINKLFNYEGRVIPYYLVMLDYFSRITTTYLLYQFVRSFRLYG